LKQEIQLIGNSVDLKLPIFSDKSMLAYARIQLTVSEADEDMQSTVQDIKALATAVVTETQKVLTQIVYA
jgi:polyhydroxyalkanoate synthesis regulator protein